VILSVLKRFHESFSPFLRRSQTSTALERSETVKNANENGQEHWEAGNVHALHDQRNITFTVRSRCAHFHYSKLKESLLKKSIIVLVVDTKNTLINSINLI
jgi:hypothetical protein